MHSSSAVPKAPASVPLVTIGVPIYNAEDTLRRALQSVLAQDYPNLEIIISDNASTDGTEAICRECAARDRRIRYIRQPVNQGPNWNFNHVVGLANGKYFLRNSHDDVRGASYVSRCVAALEANPAAVHGHSYTAAFYDGDPSNVMCVLTHDSVVGIRDPRARFIAALRHLPASALDGVFRTDVLRRKTRLMGPYLSSDIVLTHELALHGEFVQVPEVLFWRSGKTILAPPADVDRWHRHRDPLAAFPFLVLLKNHLRSIRRSPLTAVDKVLLSLRLLAHEVRTVFVKATFRAATVALGEHCPAWMLRSLLTQPSVNPNVRLLKHPLELPPPLRPTWRLLNHRHMDSALRLQQKLDAKLYPSRA